MVKFPWSAPSLEDELINLRLTSKQMQRASKKCEKNEKEAVTKLKKVRGDSAIVALSQDSETRFETRINRTWTGNKTGESRGSKDICPRCDKRKEPGEARHLRINNIKSN